MVSNSNINDMTIPMKRGLRARFFNRNIHFTGQDGEHGTGISTDIFTSRGISTWQAVGISKSEF